MNKIKIALKENKFLFWAVMLINISFGLYAGGNNDSAGSGNSAAQTQPNVPQWVLNLEQVYPDRDWVAVSGQGTSQTQAEAAAMNALARAFRTDIAGLNQASLSFSQIVNNATGNIAFSESRNFSQEVNTTSNINGLIGVQFDTFRAEDRTVYVNARMNRRECAARYSAVIRENNTIINRLITSAAALAQDSLDAYARLSFAHAIAQVTDNFQHILEVLDPSAVNNRPSYGGANSIKARMLEIAALITIGIDITTEQSSDRTLFTRAAGTYFRDLGFKINEGPLVQGQWSYALRANARFEGITQSVLSSRYFLDAALENRNGAAVFSFTEDDRRSHPNNASEARRLAVRAVEESFKDGKFAQEFNSWLNSLLD